MTNIVNVTDERLEALKKAAHICHEVTAWDVANVLNDMVLEVEARGHPPSRPASGRSEGELIDECIKNPNREPHVVWLQCLLDPIRPVTILDSPWGMLDDSMKYWEEYQKDQTFGKMMRWLKHRAYFNTWHLYLLDRLSMFPNEEMHISTLPMSKRDLLEDISEDLLRAARKGDLGCP